MTKKNISIWFIEGKQDYQTINKLFLSTDLHGISNGRRPEKILVASICLKKSINLTKNRALILVQTTV